MINVNSGWMDDNINRWMDGWTADDSGRQMDG